MSVPTPLNTAGRNAGTSIARQTLADLLNAAGLPASLQDLAVLPGHDPVLPSSFAVGAAAQASMAAAALAAVHLGQQRGAQAQTITVDMRHAALECCNYFLLDGKRVDISDKLTGLYRCGDGRWVRLHANFAHHRDGALTLLDCPMGPDTGRAQVEQALTGWAAQDVEDAMAQAGLVATRLRSFAEWDAHPQGQAVARLPLLTLERIGEAAPVILPDIDRATMPLAGVRVLDLTRILAGPAGSRALAAYGAEVLMVNAPHLPNIRAIAEMSLGKRSAHLDLREQAGRAALHALLADAHVLMQGYRPGALAALGAGPEDCARIRPGIVYVSLSAYGHVGPWAGRRGFDSLVQTASGFNDAEQAARGAATPQALPMQILDYASGFLMALGAQAALARQREEGGSWHVRVSLAQTGRWLRHLPGVAHGFDCAHPGYDGVLATEPSGFGALTAVRPAVQFSRTPARYAHRAEPPGTHQPCWLSV